MNLLETVSNGIHGALRLARGQPEGVALVQNDHTAVLRSFWSIPLCLPAVICMKLLAWLDTGIPTNPSLSLGRYLLVFGVSWLLFVVASHYLAATVERQATWPRFIAIWSYCSVIENTLVALGALPGALGAPEIVDQVCQLVTIGYAMWLEWYAIRLSLEVGRLTAAIILAVDCGIGLVMGVIGGMSG